MVQFLSMIFFSWISSIFLGFFKSSRFFCVTCTCSSLSLHLLSSLFSSPKLDCVWNVMAHAQKPYVVFRRNGRVHLDRQGPQFTRLLAAELCASAVVMLDTPCSEEVWRVLATHSIRQFPLHFSSRSSPWTITFQLDSIHASISCSHMGISETKIFLHVVGVYAT